jgi:hypothetical protein
LAPVSLLLQQSDDTYALACFIRQEVTCVAALTAGVSLDINFEVSVVPGPPASWSVAIVDYRKGAAAAAAAAAGKAGEADAAADLSSIPCGQPFYLEIEALDACHNR